MKKFLALLLAALMLLSLTACGSKDEAKNVVKIGVLEVGDTENRIHNHQSGTSAEEEPDFIEYGNLSAALMDLESGKINYIGLEESTANYIAARNDKISVVEIDKKTDLSMTTLGSNKEVYDLLNNAIVEMKADGTLDTLIENELKAYIESDPEAKGLPSFDGAKTIKVGVTGDLPPMDFVAANGKAAGFNIALLSEIANRAQVNIELVQIETGARAMALSAGTVDAVFWTKNVACSECDSVQTENVTGMLVTESYFSDSAARIALKSAK